MDKLRIEEKAWSLLADIYRNRNQPELEAAMLSEHLQRSADDLESAMRLQVLSEQQNQPARVIELGRAVFAIDPFQTEALLRTVVAAESLGQSGIAVSQLTSLLQLQPDDSARIHFRIATLLKTSDQPASRRHVLLALEQAPRFREAHRLLLKLATPLAPPSGESKGGISPPSQCVE